MADKNIHAIWGKISVVIADEISSNADFAQKMSEAVGDDDSTVTQKRKNRRPPAKIDPFPLLEQGEDKLSEALAGLSIDELKDVISANGMDTAKLAMKWKDRNRLEKHIIESTKRKSARGEAFWNTHGQVENDANSN